MRPPTDYQEPPERRTAAKIALIYLLVGAAWILLSDIIAWAVANGNLHVLTMIQTYKGWFYVAATGWMLYSLIRSDMRALRRSEEARREAEMRIQSEAETAKREFYRGTIFSVTNGKLNLVAVDEIASLLGTPLLEMTLRTRDDLSDLRNAVGHVSTEAGVSEDRTFAFISAVGEAAANAIKHAGGGVASVSTTGDRLQVCIQDSGPGMDTLVLPKATLMRRFSTTTSMGLGYSMILESVDRVHLATGPHGTSVLLEMYVEEPRHEMSLDALPDTW